MVFFMKIDFKQINSAIHSHHRNHWILFGDSYPIRTTC
ncbi:hypothetical protein C7S17_5923 [Burkholderia thailandensis]|nr:hypothetical protein [Burkholderia thailandensis]